MLLAATLVGVVVFAGARLIRGDGGTASSTPDERDSRSNASTTIPAEEKHDADREDRADPESDQIAGATSDVADAENAALDIVRSLGEVARAGFISRRELVQSFTTDEFGTEFASETGRQVDTLLMELGARGVDDDGLVIHEQPITVASTGSADAVRVQTWSVMIVTVPDLGPARQVWRTITLDMVGVDGVWLLDGWESEIGPTPAPPAEGLVDTADSVAEVLTWRRVDGGEG